MNRTFSMAAALACYAAFFAAFVYFAGFVAGFPALPTHVDKGIAAPPAVAAIVDLGLIALFGIQHSVMARPGFKQAWTRIVPPQLERSIYCLAASLALAVMFVFWCPIPAVLWDVTDPLLRALLWAVFGLGFAIVFISTWLISHFELFGLAQAWRHFRGTEAAPPTFRTPAFYRAVRHPIYLGFFLAMWATPHMTVGHMVLAGGLTLYLLVGIHYEERDLVANFGTQYEDYRRRVGMLIPGLGRR